MIKTYAGRMTRTYAARRLLEHGALTSSEVKTIAGWPAPIVATVLGRLASSGEVTVRNVDGRRYYMLARNMQAIEM